LGQPKVLISFQSPTWERHAGGREVALDRHFLVHLQQGNIVVERVGVVAVVVDDFDDAALDDAGFKGRVTVVFQ
jgi:hypothetical protein